MWEKCNIGDLTQFHKQGYYTKEKYEDDGEVFLLRGTDMQNPTILFTDAPKINVSRKDYEDFKVLPGDFLIVRSGAIGRYGIASDSFPKSIFGSYLINFRFNTKRLLNEYFGYFYESDFSLKQLLGISQGGANININADNIKKMKIDLPPLPEQKKIAEILSTWDEAIELKTKVMAELSNNLQKNIDTLTKTNTFIDEKYLDMSFNDLASFVNGFPFDSSTYQDNGKYKIVTIGNVQDGYFDLSSNVKYINNLPVGIDEKQILKTGDIIMSMTGNVGRVCQVNHEDCLLNQRVGKIVPHKNVNRLYLFYAVRSRRFIRKMITSSQGGAQPNLSTKDIKSYRFAIPGLETQKVVAGYLQLYESNIKLLSKEIDLLKTQKQGLMQRLLTGKVRVKLD